MYKKDRTQKRLKNKKKDRTRFMLERRIAVSFKGRFWLHEAQPFLTI